MTQACPKCGSHNTYEIGRDYGCRMCGKQYPRAGSTLIIIKERTKDMTEEIKKYPSGKKGICSNCGREKFIADKNGNCGTCSSVVKGMDAGSAAYAAALATIKDHLSAPGFKTRPTGRKPARKKRISPENVKHGMNDRALTNKPPAQPKLKKRTLDMTIKEVANTGLFKIIQLMRDEQAYYLAEANKLEKAINLLESL